jgi:hypothetical protein
MREICLSGSSAFVNICGFRTGHHGGVYTGAVTGGFPVPPIRLHKAEEF